MSVALKVVPQRPRHNAAQVFFFMTLHFISKHLTIVYFIVSRIPTGELGVKWVEFINLYNPWFKLSKWAMVCGNYFTENDWYFIYQY